MWPKVGDFDRPTEDKFLEFSEAFEIGLGNCPRLRESVATFECSTYSRHKEGGHTILIGNVEQISSSTAAPLVARAGELGTLAEIN